jgi:hypothetical protein
LKDFETAMGYPCGVHVERSEADSFDARGPEVEGERLSGASPGSTHGASPGGGLSCTNNKAESFGKRNRGRVKTLEGFHQTSRVVLHMNPLVACPRPRQCTDRRGKWKLRNGKSRPQEAGLRRLLQRLVDHPPHIGRTWQPMIGRFPLPAVDFSRTADYISHTDNEGRESSLNPSWGRP